MSTSSSGSPSFEAVSYTHLDVYKRQEEELRRRVHDLGHRLEQQGLTIEQFLGATGRDAESLIAELRIDALRGVKADLGLRALADAEDLQVDDTELELSLIHI